VAERVSQIPRSGIRDFFDIVSTTKDAISLGIGEPGLATPWHIRDASMYSLERGATGYTSNLGLQELREGIAGYLENHFQVSYSPADEILVTAGVSEALDLAIRAVVDPGDEVIYHEPSYVSYQPVVALAQGVPVPINTDQANGFRITSESISRKLTAKTKAIILSYPNNPTGAILPVRELEGIAELARQHDLLLISDEIYAELTYTGTHVSVASLDEMKERTVFLHGFSKAWAMTGFRIGYCCGPAELIEALMTIHQYTMLCAPVLSQLAAIEALKRAETDVKKMRERYLLNRNFIHRSLAEMNLPCPTPEGAFYAFPYVANLGLSSQEFALRLLLEEGVAVVPGVAFGACGEGFVRCSYATSLEDLKIALARMERFVQKSRQESCTRASQKA
jgi:aminotransferase